MAPRGSCITDGANPSLPTYDKLRRALGLDLASSLALLPTATPASLPERFLTTAAAVLITADRLAAVGVAAVDDGVTIELTVLAHASQAVEHIRPLEAVPTLTTEAVMTLVIVGHLGEATRRDIDERRRRRQHRRAGPARRPGPTNPTHRPGRHRTTQRLPTHHPRADSGRPQHPGVLPSLVPPADKPHRSANPHARSGAHRLRSGPRLVATRAVSVVLRGVARWPCQGQLPPVSEVLAPP